MTSVLITDGLLRKSLAAARSLGSRGITVYTAERTRLTPAAFSRYSSRALHYPDPALNRVDFYRWLVKTVVDLKCDVLFPMDDLTIDVVMEHKEEFERLCKCVLPPRESYAIASDKYLSTMLAAQAGVPSPRTILPDDLSQLRSLAKQLSYPVVIKPRKSSGSRGIRIVMDEQELVKEYCEIRQNYPNPMIQEYIPTGERYDVCLLFDGGDEPRCSFVQREVRHFPVDIGPSTVQESVFRPDILQLAKLMMQKLKWRGVVEIEFMIDPRNLTPVFMEINPRFWNSLYMATVAGIDFPFLLYQLATTGEVDEAHTYEAGKMCRNLLPGDCLHYLFTKSRKQMSPPFLAAASSQLKDDVLAWDDPLPTLGFVAGSLRYLLDRKMWSMVFKR